MPQGDVSNTLLTQFNGIRQRHVPPVCEVLPHQLREELASLIERFMSKSNKLLQWA
jgi:hypothetical protein